MREPPGWLTEEPLASVRRALLRGRDGWTLQQVKYGEDAATLVMASPNADGAQEWVLRRPWAEPAELWRYPHDPYLPALEKLPATGRRLAYQPGRRATFLVDAEGGREVWKVLRSADSDACRRAVTAVADAAPSAGVGVPRLLRCDPDTGWLRLSWLDGEPLHRSGASGRETAVADVLATLTRLPPPDVPAWTAARDASKLRRYLALLAEVDPEAADAKSEQAAELATALDAAPAVSTRWIHRDFTVRHVLVSPAGLAVLDWDGAAPGPVEKDLATMIPGLTRAGGSPDRFLTAYQAAAGPVDRGLLARLVAVQVVVRLLRRALRDSDRAALSGGTPE